MLELPQEMQTLPLAPQASSEVPDKQVLPEQQPLQLSWLQPPPQVPPPTPFALHTALPEHAIQAWPASPHAALLVPDWQTPSASQQPLQVSRLHGRWALAPVLPEVPPGDEPRVPASSGPQPDAKSAASNR
jgi:hypothetical protein